MNVYEARHAGRTYCNDTEGSEHYKQGGVEPLDLLIAKGLIEDFCIGNMVKYATRFKITRNLVDLKKVSDYAHILCGVELDKNNTHAAIESEPNSHRPTQAEYEELFTEDKPKGKYEGLSNQQLHTELCKRFEDCDIPSNCPLYREDKRSLLDNCFQFVDDNPADFRKIAIAHLEGLEGKA